MSLSTPIVGARQTDWAEEDDDNEDDVDVDDDDEPFPELKTEGWTRHLMIWSSDQLSGKLLVAQSSYYAWHTQLIKMKSVLVMIWLKIKIN